MATLIDVATPGPALTLNKTAQAGASGLYSDNSLTETTAGTVYQLDSISITAGTWVVIGITYCGSVNQTNYLNLVTATGSNSWPAQATVGGSATNQMIAAVIKVSSTTTIYLNGKNTTSNAFIYPAMFAVQIA
jgi:hypothetical protein